MIDFLLSTGIRVGELVRLNIDDIDFSERECVVYGKGDKERKTYFDAKAKIHLINYIESRMDDNSALFVSLNKPHSTVIVLNVMLTLWSVKNIYVVIINRPNRTLKTFSLRECQIPICRTHETFSLTEWQIPICLTVSM